MPASTITACDDSHFEAVTLQIGLPRRSFIALTEAHDA
ncbi:hypothetical protein B0G81_0268 [Paraburkholderia sp. BL6665CI2N2]|nr:hypothetical protein B0G81_0268 [Paraburkholderia sp. BL6665CI2N2]